MYIDLVLNLSLLVALVVISTLMERRATAERSSGAFLQGLLFGCVAIIGMLKPAVLMPGVIFDGRSIILSLCGLFFGEYAILPAMSLSIICRVMIGGSGMITGILSILVSSFAGLYYRRVRKGELKSLTGIELLKFGFFTHCGVALMMITFPGTLSMEVLGKMTLPFLVLYPIATLFAGKILLQHRNLFSYTDELIQINREQQAVFESIGDGVIVVDSNGRIINMNPAAERLTGWNLNEAKGKSFSEIVRIVDEKNIYQSLDKQIEDSIKTDKSVEIDGSAILISRQGERRYIAAHIHPIKTGNGEIYGAVCGIHDCSKEKEAEIALRESEQKYRTLVETGPSMVWMSGIDRQFDYFSPQWIRFRGKTFEEEKGFGWKEGVHPEDSEKCFKIYSEAFDRREPFELLCRLRRYDGQYRWILNYAAPRYDSNGNFIGYIGYAFDITEQKEAESKIQILLKAIEHSGLSVIITDREKRILYVNPAFTLITGYSMEESIGKTPEELIRSHIHSKEFYESLENTLKEGKVWKGEIIDRRKDGNIFYTNSIIVPIKNENNEIINYFLILEDLTERKLLQEQLIHAQKMEVLGRLTSGVAHDFNNAISVVNLSVDMLSNFESLSDGGVKNIQLMKKAVENATYIANRILAFSRGKPGEMSVLDINEVVGGMSKMLQRLLGSDITIKIRALPLKEEVLIKGDRGSIEQVLMNLAINARDAMPHGGILEIETDYIYIERPSHPEARRGEFVKLSVKDTGTGILPEVLPHIFEPFFTTKPQGKGSGLGLSIVKEIIKSHNGWIEVESTPGIGTKFTIYFPRYFGEKPTATIPAEAKKQLSGTERLLIVDDDGAIRTLTSRLLNFYGYNVIDAPDRQTAIDKFDELGGKIDLALIDIVLPGRHSGYTLAEELLKKNPNLKIVFMSGYPGETEKGVVNLIEGDNFLSKPINEADLLRIIRKNLDKK